MSVKRIKNLVKQLNEYRHAYYNQDAPLVSDAEYDRLFDELKELEEQTGFILSNSPTQTVGYYPVSELAKVTHPIPLLSLEKTKLISEEYTFHPAPYQRSSYEFEYRMLSKLQSDCEYYLGYGNRSPSILCNHSVQNHIARMKELWNGFPTDQKPEWLTWEQLLQYEKVMTETGIPVKNCSD